MDYEPLLGLPDVESVFRTSRGSTYAYQVDPQGQPTTTRNRSGAQHRDPTTGVQPRSGRTIFVSPEHVNNLALFQNPDMATRFVPVMQDGKPTGYARLELTEDYGPRKAGTALAMIPYDTKPAVGLQPVEVWRSSSPIGDPGKGIHVGTPITEIYPKPDRLKGVKAGVAGLLAGGAGAAKAATQGDFGPAREFVGEMLTPLGATPTDVNRGEQEWIERYGSAAQRRYEQEAERAIDRMRAYAKGGAVPMPSAYSKGNWKLI
jgi:hypothetical protein